MGWEPVAGPHALRRAGYLAGSDDERLADLSWALQSDDVDGVWCLRGGYGTMRLLDRLDLAALHHRPKALLGFSDVTALHAAVGRACGLVTYHAPVARGQLTAFSEQALRAAVVRQVGACGVAADGRTLRPGRAYGHLAGGNLALLAALCGTPYLPVLDGAILVIEDVHEAVYRVDRMLQQLRLSGALHGLRGLVVGQFTDVPTDGDEGDRPLDDVVAEVADRLGVPCLAGVPVGHVDAQWTLPLGAAATLDATACRLDVEPPLARHGTQAAR